MIKRSADAAIFADSERLDMKSILLALSALLVIAGVFSLPVASDAGSLTVGTKVIYSGGSDQPPVEKDTGVKFSTGKSSVAPAGSTADNGPSEQSSLNSPAVLDAMMENGEFDELLLAVEGREDPDSQAYMALAMSENGDSEKAEAIARNLLKAGQLKPELRKKLLEAFDLDEEDLNEAEDTE